MLSYAPKVVKANPANMNFLRILYNIYKESYDTSMEFDDFLNYRDSILLSTDTESAYGYTMCPTFIYAFMGCKRINATDIDDEQLRFHCLPYKISYLIDVLYFTDIMIEHDDFCNIFEMFIRTNEMSKRDAFMIVKLSEEHKNILEEKLLSLGFYASIQNENGIYTYFKSPII